MSTKNKHYLFCLLAFLFSLYLFAVTLLALLTAINSAAGYPLYNFLGSDVDLAHVVVQLLPAKNPYHLQKWSSAPYLLAPVALVLFLLCTAAAVHVAKGLIQLERQRFLRYAIPAAIIASLLFYPLYREIFVFFSALAS